MSLVKVECPDDVSEEGVQQWLRSMVATIAAPDLDLAGDVRVVKTGTNTGRLIIDIIFWPPAFSQNAFRGVDELEISVRAENCLKQLGIRTVAELVQKTGADLLQARGFGKKCLEEIKTVLGEMGLSLGTKLDEAEVDILRRACERVY